MRVGIFPLMTYLNESSHSMGNNYLLYLMNTCTSSTVNTRSQHLIGSCGGSMWRNSEGWSTTSISGATSESCGLLVV